MGDGAAIDTHDAVRPPRTAREVMLWALATASLGAAAIHFAVIGEHFREAWYFGVFFTVVAWLQVAWGLALLWRPRRRLLLAGAALQTMVVVIYFWSRTTGLPIGPEPWQPESWAFLDVFCTVLEVAAAGGAALLVFRPLQRPVSRELAAALTSGLVVGVVGVTSAALLVTPPEMPGMDTMATAAAATNHNGDMSSMSPHGGSGGSIGMGPMGSTSTTAMATMSSTGPGGTSGSMGTMGTMGNGTTSTMANMGNGSTTTTMAGMGTTTTMPGMGDGSFELATMSPAGDIMWPMMQMNMGDGMELAEPNCTTAPTAAQKSAAVSFVNTTVTATTKYRSLAAAKADGFVPVTPTGASVVHYINWSRMAEDVTTSDVLIPSQVQSLVYANTATGPRLVAAMYLMPNGSTATPPQPGGCLTQWHIHTNLCFNSSNVVVGITNSQGKCPAGSTNRVTQPMIHVWLAPITGGPLMVDAPDAQVVAAANQLPVVDAPPEKA
jgi:hypothetical protein